MLFLPLSPEQTLPPSWAARLSTSSLQHSDMCNFPRGLSAEIRRGSVRLPRWEMGQISSRLESDISKYFLNRWLGHWGASESHNHYISGCPRPSDLHWKMDLKIDKTVLFWHKVKLSKSHIFKQIRCEGLKGNNYLLFYWNFKFRKFAFLKSYVQF